MVDTLPDMPLQADWDGRRTSEPVQGAALVGKALSLVDLIGEAPRPVSGADLARKTGWPRPTLYRILSAVVAHDYVRVDPSTGGYTLGFRLLEHAQTIWSGSGLVAVASVELQRLRDMTGETTYLAVPHDGSMLGIGRFEGLHPIRSSARLGAEKPMHCTSQGKAILACMSEEEVTRMIAETPLVRMTPNTITDPQVLASELAVVRQRGFATEDEEVLLGTRCVGAAIVEESGAPVAAISVAAPTWRLTPDRVAQLGPEIATVARAISQRMGPSRTVLQPPAPGEVLPHPAPQDPAFYGADPHWDRTSGILRWTDRLAPCIHETDDHASTVRRLPIEAEVEAAVLWPGRSLVMMGGRLLDRQGNSWSEIRWPAERGAITAATAAPNGRIWVATTSPSRNSVRDLSSPAESVWTLRGRIAALAACHLTGRVYAADPLHRSIFLLDASRNPRLLTRLPAVSGEPRGLTVDGAGQVWVALDGGWSVVRLSADGEVERVIALPVPRPTGLTFGGTTQRTLYIATARAGLTRDTLEKAPLSGKVLMTRV